MDIKLLHDLSLTPGVPGREHRLREFIGEVAAPLFDELWTDALGNLIGRRGPRPASDAPSEDPPLKVMVAAHMDQIGFLVRHIDDAGFLRVQAVGGFDTRNLFARLVTVCTADGDLTGVMNPAGRPVHVATDEERKKIPEVHELMIDLGLDAEQVKARVRIGDMVTLQAPFHEVGRTVVGQCLDNRVGCWALIEAIRQLEHHPCEIFAAFTCQEEVGCRGAGPATQQINPDVAIALDTTLCIDTPGVPDDQRCTRQGEGAGLMVLDSSAIVDPVLLDEFERLAVEHGIKTQRTMLPRGGTDASTIQRKAGGYRVMTLVCPTRYIHTVTEMIHQDDLRAYRDLLATYLGQASR